MSQSCTSASVSDSLQQLQKENFELRRYLDAQKKVILSLERRIGRSLESLGVHVERLVTTTPVGCEWQTRISSVHQEVDGLCDLLADAMLLQKFEAGKVEVNLESLPLQVVLQSVTRPLLKGDSASRLICEFEPNLPPVFADAALLEAVLTDLLARGLRYSDADFPVVLGTRQESNQAQLYVTAQRFAPLGNRDFATEIVLCCRRIEVQKGTVTCQQCSTGLQTVILSLPVAP